MGNITREGNAGDGGLGEFPSGESPIQGQETADGEGESTDGSEGGVEEPGFGERGETSGAGGMPDLSDEPSLEDAMASFEDAMGEGEASGSMDGMPGGSPTGGGNGSMPSGQDSGGGVSGLPPGTYGTGIPGSDGVGSGNQGSGTYGSGPLTPAEQVAILDAQLERGAGDFDAMILEEQTEQRRAARERASTTAPSQPSNGGGGGSSAYEEGGMADAGSSSTGGGMGGVSGGGAGIPKNTAKYPPPGDIPAGTDDDVVARQLREAAMREPDPALREKLWDEYRKYKGID